MMPGGSRFNDTVSNNFSPQGIFIDAEFFGGLHFFPLISFQGV